MNTHPKHRNIHIHTHNPREGKANSSIWCGQRGHKEAQAHEGTAKTNEIGRWEGKTMVAERSRESYAEEGRGGTGCIH